MLGCCRIFTSSLWNTSLIPTSDGCAVNRAYLDRTKRNHALDCGMRGNRGDSPLDDRGCVHFARNNNVSCETMGKRHGSSRLGVFYLSRQTGVQWSQTIGNRSLCVAMERTEHHEGKKGKMARIFAVRPIKMRFIRVISRNKWADAVIKKMFHVKHSDDEPICRAKTV